MAYPTKLYAATATEGVYYSGNFTGPTGAMPTWAAVNGGLASLNMSGLELDPANPNGHQYALAEGVIYGRAGGGNWTVLLSLEDSQAIASSSVPPSGSVVSISVDPITGYIYGLFMIPPGHVAGSKSVCLRSVNQGASWSGTYLDDGTTGQDFIRWPGTIQAYNGIVVATLQHYMYTVAVLLSKDNGVTFGWNLYGAGSIMSVCAVHLNRADQLHAYINSRYGGSTYDLGALDLDVPIASLYLEDITILQDALDIGPFWAESVWSDTTDPSLMASAAHQIHTKLWRTTDAWATLVDGAQGASDRTYLRIICPQSVYGEWILGATDAGGTCVRVSADGVTTVDRSGTNNGMSPYTDAIPDTCDGIVALRAVIDVATEGPTPPPGETITPPGGSPITLGGTANVQAVTFPDYEEYDMGEPMPGDRGAYLVNTETRAKLHASDVRRNIEDGSVTRIHLPLSGNAVGDGVVWNGSAWVVANIVTATELAATDAADLTSGASTDGQVLTSDGAAGAAWENLPALADHDHSGDAGDGSQLDWDSVWSDAVHSHASDAEGGVLSGFSGELLMADGVTAPPVPIETEDQTDWLYEG